MNNVFEELLTLPGAALVLADKLSGRIIGRIADGFDDDPALESMMNLFRAIENKWPDQVLSLREMFEVQLKSASKDTEASSKAMEGLTDKQRQIWLGEQTRTRSPIDKLQQALPKIVDLYASASNADTKRWEDLTTINQWSLLNATEKGVHDRLQRYKKWATEDHDKGRTESDAITLFEDTGDAIEPLYELITQFLDDPIINAALEADSSNGIRVPIRCGNE
jgi:hypothetical protein